MEGAKKNGACPLGDLPVTGEHDYTVLRCCESRRFHAGCIHRKFVSGPLRCPRCDSLPDLPFETPAGAMPETTEPSDERLPSRRGWMAAALELLLSSPARSSVDEPLEKEGRSPRDLRHRGPSSKDLAKAGLSRNVARKHAAGFASVYGRDAVERAFDAAQPR